MKNRISASLLAFMLVFQVLSSGYLAPLTAFANESQTTVETTEEQLDETLNTDGSSDNLMDEKASEEEKKKLEKAQKAIASLYTDDKQTTIVNDLADAMITTVEVSVNALSDGADKEKLQLLINKARTLVAEKLAAEKLKIATEEGPEEAVSTDSSATDSSASVEATEPVVETEQVVNKEVEDEQVNDENTSNSDVVNSTPAAESEPVVTQSVEAADEVQEPAQVPTSQIAKPVASSVKVAQSLIIPIETPTTAEEESPVLEASIKSLLSPMSIAGDLMSIAGGSSHCGDCKNFTIKFSSTKAADISNLVITYRKVDYDLKKSKGSTTEFKTEKKIPFYSKETYKISFNYKDVSNKVELTKSTDSLTSKGKLNCTITIPDSEVPKYCKEFSIKLLKNSSSVINDAQFIKNAEFSLISSTQTLTNLKLNTNGQLINSDGSLIKPIDLTGELSKYKLTQTKAAPLYKSFANLPLTVKDDCTATVNVGDTACKSLTLTLKDPKGNPIEGKVTYNNPSTGKSITAQTLSNGKLTINAPYLTISEIYLTKKGETKPQTIKISTTDCIQTIVVEKTKCENVKITIKDSGDLLVKKQVRILDKDKKPVTIVTTDTKGLITISPEYGDGFHYIQYEKPGYETKEYLISSDKCELTINVGLVACKNIVVSFTNNGNKITNVTTINVVNKNGIKVTDTNIKVTASGASIPTKYFSSDYKLSYVIPGFADATINFDPDGCAWVIDLTGKACQDTLLTFKNNNVPVSDLTVTFKKGEQTETFTTSADGVISVPVELATGYEYSYSLKGYDSTPKTYAPANICKDVIDIKDNKCLNINVTFKDGETTLTDVEVIVVDKQGVEQNTVPFKSDIAGNVIIPLQYNTGEYDLKYSVRGYYEGTIAFDPDDCSFEVNMTDKSCTEDVVIVFKNDEEEATDLTVFLIKTGKGEIVRTELATNELGEYVVKRADLDPTYNYKLEYSKSNFKTTTVDFDPRTCMVEINIAPYACEDILVSFLSEKELVNQSTSITFFDGTEEVEKFTSTTGEFNVPQKYGAGTYTLSYSIENYHAGTFTNFNPDNCKVEIDVTNTACVDTYVTFKNDGNVVNGAKVTITNLESKESFEVVANNDGLVTIEKQYLTDEYEFSYSILGYSPGTFTLAAGVCDVDIDVTGNACDSDIAVAFLNGGELIEKTVTVQVYKDGASFADYTAPYNDEDSSDYGIVYIPAVYAAAEYTLTYMIDGYPTDVFNFNPEGCADVQVDITNKACVGTEVKFMSGSVQVTGIKVTVLNASSEEEVMTISEEDGKLIVPFTYQTDEFKLKYSVLGNDSEELTLESGLCSTEKELNCSEHIIYYTGPENAEFELSTETTSEPDADKGLIEENPNGPGEDTSVIDENTNIPNENTNESDENLTNPMSIAEVRIDKLGTVGVTTIDGRQVIDLRDFELSNGSYTLTLVDPIEGYNSVPFDFTIVEGQCLTALIVTPKETPPPVDPPVTPVDPPVTPVDPPVTPPVNPPVTPPACTEAGITVRVNDVLTSGLRVMVSNLSGTVVSNYVTDSLGHVTINSDYATDQYYAVVYYGEGKETSPTTITNCDMLIVVANTEEAETPTPTPEVTPTPEPTPEVTPTPEPTNPIVDTGETPEANTGNETDTTGTETAGTTKPVNAKPTKVVPTAVADEETPVAGALPKTGTENIFLSSLAGLGLVGAGLLMMRRNRRKSA